jgi:hypothetical protein
VMGNHFQVMTRKILKAVEEPVLFDDSAGS